MNLSWHAFRENGPKTPKFWNFSGGGPPDTLASKKEFTPLSVPRCLISRLPHGWAPPLAKTWIRPGAWTKEARFNLPACARFRTQLWLPKPNRVKQQLELGEVQNSQRYNMHITEPSPYFVYVTHVLTSHGPLSCHMCLRILRFDTLVLISDVISHAYNCTNQRCNGIATLLERDARQ